MTGPVNEHPVDECRQRDRDSSCEYEHLTFDNPVDSKFQIFIIVYMPYCVGIRLGDSPSFRALIVAFV